MTVNKLTRTLRHAFKSLKTRVNGRKSWKLFFVLTAFCFMGIISHIQKTRSSSSAASARKNVSAGMTTSISDDVATRTRKQSRSIYFVRVGKAGGTSIDNAILAACGFDITCVDVFMAQRANGTESMLSFLTSQVGHMEDVTLDHTLEGRLLQNITSFLFNLRNPIDRIVSAYDFAMPRNTDPKFATEEAFENATVGDHIGEIHEKRYQFYHDCFPSFSLLLSALNVSDASGSCECQRYAVSVLQGRRQDANLGWNMIRDPMALRLNGFDHFFQNYMRYANATVYHYQEAKEVLVVRTESLWEDLKQLDVFLGGTGKLTGTGTHTTHGSEKKPVRSQAPRPGSSEAFNLCCVLYQDIGVYQDLMVQATNLQKAQKLKTLQRVYSQCGIRHSSRNDDGWNDIWGFSWSNWSRDECPMMPTRICQERPMR